MKLLVILSASTRGGIDFFQSLLDKHSQISQLPGQFYIDDFFKEIDNEKTMDQIADRFINNYERYFDSALDKVERHNNLGENKNKSYKVDKKIFKQIFKTLMSEKKINKKNIIMNLHLAYSKASGEDISKKKIIVLQIHHFFRIKSILELEFDILCTIRDPLGSYSSYVKNLAFFHTKDVSPWQFYYHIERTFEHLNQITKLNSNTLVLRLEDIHTDNKRIMKKFCDFYNLEYETSLENSTFQGLLWWGDRVSKKNLNGVNKNFKNNIDKSVFFENDIRVIEYYMSNYIKTYQYEFRSKKLGNKILKFLPLKFELFLLKYNFKRLNFKNVLYVFYYYLKRVNIMNIDKLNIIKFPTKF